MIVWFNNVYLLAAVIDFGMQIAFGTIAVIKQTEKFYDLVGSATFIIVSIVGCSIGSYHPAKVIQCVCICLWATKLGAFLFYRVIQSGSDKRFDRVKKKPLAFYLWWMIQGSWVYANLLPSLIMFTFKENREPIISPQSVAGWAIFAAGLIFETVADIQKTRFRNTPANKGRFISTGLWSVSRHPNYFGEIVLWFGLFISAAAYFQTSWSFFSIFCPVSAAMLICFISGIPLLEKSGMERWGNDADYAEYVHNTGVLIPFLNCCECTPLPSKDLLISEASSGNAEGDNVFDEGVFKEGGDPFRGGRDPFKVTSEEDDGMEDVQLESAKQV